MSKLLQLRQRENLTADKVVRDLDKKGYVMSREKYYYIEKRGVKKYDDAMALADYFGVRVEDVVEETMKK